MAFYSGPPCDVGVLESRECAKTCTLSTGCWVLAAIILGSSLAFIDGNAVSVALTGTAEGPRHQRDADAVGGGGRMLSSSLRCSWWVARWVTGSI